MMNRRGFVFSTLLALGTPQSSAALLGGRSKKPAIKPRRLSAGDTVGLVAPASAAFEQDAIALAKEQLEAIGFKVKVGEHAHDRWGYFAGRDRDRAADINRMFADDSVAGIVCYTGGWGSPRVLPYLDYPLIARKPKVFVGFSDITALLIAIYQRTGLVTFHGPVGGSNLEPYSLESFRRSIMNADPIGELAAPEKKPSELVNRGNRIVKLAGGKARGRLVGGNLTLVAAMMGTPWEIETEGAIVFLEDVREDVYRIDRMLTQLSLGGKFDKAAGVVFGRCSQCAYEGPSFSLEDILRDRFGSLPIPAISGLSFGHIEQKLTLPLGVMATIDADSATLTVEEGAVI